LYGKKIQISFEISINYLPRDQNASLFSGLVVHISGGIFSESFDQSDYTRR